MSDQRVLSIHQPNFFPWLGFFQKIIRSDCFVFLDHVAANPDQSWVKRVKILNQGKSQWLSLPIQTQYCGDGFPRIQELQLNQRNHFSAKQLRTIEINYRDCEHFRSVFPLVQSFYSNEDASLVNRNCSFIRDVCRMMNIDCDFVRSSTLNCSETSTDLLIEIARKLKATTYLCGDGSGGYQEDGKFSNAKIQLRYQEFQHPSYFQSTKHPFVPGLSILDPLMRLGVEATRNLIAPEG